MSDRKRNPELADERHSKARRDKQHLLDLLQNRDLAQEGVETVFGCRHAAQLLFSLIREAHGEDVARQIFMRLGYPPTPEEQRILKNYSLLDRLDIMKPRNIRRLARETAKRNGSMAPSARDRGPSGSIDENTLDRHIRRLVARRQAEMKRGTWRGPRP